MHLKLQLENAKNKWLGNMRITPWKNLKVEFLPLRIQKYPRHSAFSQMVDII